jgi:hypothetical protein
LQTIQPSSFLRGALLADAVVSGAVALLQLALTGMLVGLLHLPASLLTGTGAFLVAYVVLLLVLARSARVWPLLIWIVVLGNLAWAVGCVALMFGANPSPSGLGMAFLGVQAITVLIFAGLEFKGLGESAGGTSAVAVRS